MIPTIAAHAPDECITACHDIGRRHFPEEVPESNVSVAERPESFEMRSTQDMYKEFPGLIRSSYPLYIRNAGPQVCACCPNHSIQCSLRCSPSCHWDGRSCNPLPLPTIKSMQCGIAMCALLWKTDWRFLFGKPLPLCAAWHAKAAELLQVLCFRKK